MSTWTRFWIAALGWSALLAALLVAHSLVIHFTNDTYRGPGATVLALHPVAREVGLFFPLMAFFAVLAAGSGPDAARRPLDTRALGTASIAAGAVAYLWLAFVEPWSRASILRWAADLAGATIDPPPVASTQVWLGTQLSNPAIGPADERFLTWLFHLPNATGLLTALLGTVGVLIGRRADTRPQRWTMAALVTVIVAPMLLGSLRLSTRYEVPPEATTYGMLLVPLVLLAVLGWVGWTERGRAPVAASS